MTLLNQRHDHQTIDERLRRNRSFSHWCSRSTRGVTHRYGIIDPLEKEGRRYEVKQFVEKPKQGTTFKSSHHGTLHLNT